MKIRPAPTSKHRRVIDVALDSIVVAPDHRPIRDEDVAAIVESLTLVGQLHPVIVTEDHHLIAGRRRLAAAKLLGWKRIRAEIVTGVDELHRDLIEIDENLIRGELTALERAEAVVRRKEIYLALRPETKHGGAPGKGGGGKQRRSKEAETASFDVATARASGKSSRTIRVDAQIGEHLDERAKELIRNTDVANNQTELLKLSRMAPGEQIKLAKAVADGKATGIRDALVQQQKAKAAAQARSHPVQATLYKADAVDFLRSLKPQSVDLLLTDPPCMTDVDDIAAFAQSWVPLALNALKPTGRAYICTGAYPQELKAYLDVLLAQQNFIVGNVLVWRYRNRIGPEKKLDYRLNWQAVFYVRGPAAPEWQDLTLDELLAVQDINAPDERQGDWFHRWQKPNGLAERFVRHGSRKGDLVVDPFAGTGTHLITATQLERVAIGCDNNDEMLAIARSRGCVISAFEPVVPDEVGQKEAAGSASGRSEAAQTTHGEAVPSGHTFWDGLKTLLNQASAAKTNQTLDVLEVEKERGVDHERAPDDHQAVDSHNEQQVAEHPTWSALRTRLKEYLAPCLYGADGLYGLTQWGCDRDIDVEVDIVRDFTAARIRNATRWTRRSPKHSELANACKALGLPRPTAGKPVDLDEARKQMQRLARGYHASNHDQYQRPIEAFVTLLAAQAGTDGQPRTNERVRLDGFWQGLKNTLEAHYAAQLQSIANTALDDVRMLRERFRAIQRRAARDLEYSPTRRRLLYACDVLELPHPKAGSPLNLEMVRKQYRGLSREHHPDRTAHEGDEQRRINDAYGWIKAFHRRVNDVADESDQTDAAAQAGEESDETDASAEGEEAAS